MARGKQKKGTRRASQDESKGCLFPLVFSLLVLGAVAWAVVTVRIGNRTLLEHARSIVNFDAPKTSVGASGATRDIERELEKKPPIRKPEQDNPPAEHITDEDRRALEALLPE